MSSSTSSGRLDAAARKELLARMMLERRPVARGKKTTDEKQKEPRWQPLALPPTSSTACLCACVDVKRGFALVCPPHMISFH